MGKKEVSFGYGQDWNWVKSQNALDSNLLTRRPTGVELFTTVMIGHTA